VPSAASSRTRRGPKRHAAAGSPRKRHFGQGTVSQPPLGLAHTYVYRYQTVRMSSYHRSFTALGNPPRDLDSETRRQPLVGQSPRSKPVIPGCSPRFLSSSAHGDGRPRPVTPRQSPASRFSAGRLKRSTRPSSPRKGRPGIHKDGDGTRTRHAAFFRLVFCFERSRSFSACLARRRWWSNSRCVFVRIATHSRSGASPASVTAAEASAV
jgi:hypothetical protein